MSLLSQYGDWACVLGAAEGLGAAFSIDLAKRGFNLILIDKKENKLSQLQNELLNKYSIEINPLIEDLNKLDCTDRIITIMQDVGCRFMIYNASYGPVRPFLSNSASQMDLHINVNIRTPLHLAHKFAATNKQKSAGILFLSSLAGLRGTQLAVPYAAGKAFIWNLAEGLYYEFRATPLNISVCILGAVDTPNYRSTNPKKKFVTPKSMDPKDAANEALNGFGRKLFIIPGRSNKISHFLLNRILPRHISSSLHNWAMKKMYG